MTAIIIATLLISGYFLCIKWEKQRLRDLEKRNRYPKVFTIPKEADKKLDLDWDVTERFYNE